ncbi:InlB B-repeat-containing protein [Paenibacillus helianthi]|nr:InlB B-repeat-containing protein [Paenibacillus helianthi]
MTNSLRRKARILSSQVNVVKKVFILVLVLVFGTNTLMIASANTPVNGNTDFDSVSGPIIISGSSTGPGLMATDINGYDFLLKSSSATNCYIGAEFLTGQTNLISGATNDGTPLSYMEVSSNSGKIFDLQSVDIAMSGVSLGTNGNIQLIGYVNGLAVSGAVMSLTVTDAYLGGQLVTFNVSSNTKFVGIDKFRIQTDGSYQVTGAFGIDNINAVNFRNTNTAPVFIGATTSFIVNQDSSATDIKGLLHVSDIDPSQVETWSPNTPPNHGTLNFLSATAASGSTDIAPGGTITYTPDSGYAGTDSFTVQVSDGTSTATRTITVTVNANPTYTVTYNGNGNTGGTVPTDSNSYPQGNIVTVLGNTGMLVKTGYTFAGWNTAANGSGTNYGANATFSMGSVNATLYAKWTANPSFTVTYNGNGSTGGTVPTDSNSYQQGNMVTVLGNTGALVKTGYTFFGWNTAANGSGTDYAANATFSMGTANATLYAKWTANPTFTVTYNGNGNTGGAVPTDSNSYQQGNTVTVLGNTGTLVKTGYTFAGWNTAANGSGTDYVANATFSMGTANATLYAKWTANQTYTVTYNGNGNTGGTVPTDSNSYPQGNSVTVLGNTGTLVKNGYTFAGWNTAANGSGTDYAANATFSMGTANATLYAKWAANPTYTVTYNGNGSTGGAVPTDSNSYPQGNTVTVLGNTGMLVKTGYTFAGWNTAANGSGTDYAANATFSMGSANPTLYAKWTANPTYTVTYNGNGNTGGAVPTDSNSYPQGNTVTVLGNTGTLVKTGYTFAGWNTAANGSGTDYAANATFSMGSANATLYAKWTANPTFTVTYNGNGSTGGTVPTDSNSYQQGNTVTVLGNTGTLVKTGYTFAGWNTAANGSGTDYAANATFSMGTANATLYAKWTANPTYTVTYNGNGSTGGAVPTDSNSYPQGNTVTVLGNTGMLVKTGYTFAGWNTAANGSGTDYAANATFSMGSANATLYAKWTANPTYTVTYNGNGSTGGAVPTDSNSYPQGNTVTVLGNTGTLVKTGYTFAGWNTKADGSGTDYGANATFSMGTANATLYAKWTANPSFTVTYNGNGNTGGTIPTDSNSYPQGNMVTVLGNTGTLVKTGYTFFGWNTAANGSGTDYATNATFSMGTANATLYAKWTANPTFTVTYNGNGNTSGTIPTDSNSYPQGNTVTVLGNTGALAKTGYTFAGWNTTANGSGTDYAANATFSMGTANATLYAKWTTNPTYTVTYNGNGSTGGTVPTDSNSYPQGNIVTVLGNTGTLVKTGYTFAGWNTAANGSGTDYAANATFSMGTANATLYAKWTANPTFTVTYNGNGSTGGTVPTDSNSYQQGHTVTVLGNTGTLVKTGYTFAGWNTKADGSGMDYTVSGSFAMGTANATLYAKWTANPTFTVTYNGNGNTGGTVPTDSNSYQQGNTVTVLGNTGALVKTGYTFVGWNTAANGSGTDYAANATFSMGSANATLYAKWTANPTFTVTYNGNGSTGGTVPTDSNSYQQGNTVTVLGNTGTLVKTGYTFAGWNTKADGSGMDYKVSGSFAMGAANVTLYAKWTANPTYTVTYNGNGNTGGAVPTDSNSYPQGNTVTVLGNTGTLVKTGYTFAGWNTAANGSGTDYAANATFSMGSANATLYAKWTANPTFTVTYNGNGSTGGAVPTDSNSYQQGNTVMVLGNTGTLVKTGYTFAGWNTAANGSGTDYGANATFSMGTANATLYAKWTSSNAQLSSLSVDQGTLTPAFTAATLKYNVNDVANSVSSSNLSFTTADSHATFTVSGAVYSSLTGNMYTYRANNLQVGANLIQISVMALDGTGNTYMVTVNREDVSRLPSPGGPPADSITPTVTPGPTKQEVDVFNSGIVNVINLVNAFESKVEKAKKSNVKVELADTKGHWAEKTIDTFVKLHVIEGYNDGTFKPDGEITRAEFAVILSRVFDIKSGNNTGVAFKDVGSHWAKGAIEKLAEAGVISGYEDVTFKPDKTITREEMVILLSRILNLNNVTKDTTKGNFNDLKGSYAANEIKAEAQAGIINGKADGKFDAKSNATRAEALQIILNALKLSPQLKTLLDSLN